MLKDVFLAGGVRTPIGRFRGGLAEVPAATLGALCVRESLARAGISPRSVDEVVIGNVVGAGLGQNIARQCSLGAGLEKSVGATTVNRVCGSGLKAVMMAAQAIQTGDADVVVAGGTENMSRAPYLLDRARDGYRLGHGQLVDSVIRDGLWDVYNDCHMGTCAETTASQLDFSRQAQDDYAILSYQRALAAAEGGITAGELCAVEHGGDGAAAITVISAEKVQELGVEPLAKIVGYTTFSREPEWFTLAPVGVHHRLFDKLGWSAKDVDVFEINEAFAVVPLVLMKEFALEVDRVNPLGGAIALGHPIGASGTRSLVTLLSALKTRGGSRGVVSLCVGGGEAVALAVEVC
jgi:acetyl-CoA C-acetyltransferase